MTRYTSHGRGWTLQRELARKMRRKPTAAEDLLWDRLRSKRLQGLKFRRQHPIGRFIVDFYCVEAGLAIEVDGPVHQHRAEEDRARQEHLESRGVKFLRFSNDDIAADIDQVLRTISAAAEANRGEPEKSVE